LAERHWRKLRIGTDGSDLHELSEAANPGLLDQVQAHREIRIEETSRVLAIRTDPADFGCEMNHDVGPVIVIHSYDAGFRREIVPSPAGHMHRFAAAFDQLRTDDPPQKTGAAGDDDAPI